MSLPTTSLDDRAGLHLTRVTRGVSSDHTTGQGDRGKGSGLHEDKDKGESETRRKGDKDPRATKMTKGTRSKKPTEHMAKDNTKRVKKN